MEPDARAVKTGAPKRIALFGSTGVAGGGVLRTLLASPEVDEVVAIARRPLGAQEAKVREVLCRDFGDLGPIASAIGRVDACCYCLGISGTGIDEATYRVITMDYALEAARTLKATSPSHTFLFVSGGGASTASRMMWARVKGETENALALAGLSGLVVLRPGFIAGDHTPGGLSLPLRLAYPIIRLGGRFIPAMSIEAEALGCAMLQLLSEDQRQGTLENHALRAAATRYVNRLHA